MIIKQAIILDGEVNGVRAWPAVPRVGDHVQIDRGASAVEVRVAKVLWRRGADAGECAVDLHCEEDGK